jgi:hypothetical protein
MTEKEIDLAGISMAMGRGEEASKIRVRVRLDVIEMASTRHANDDHGGTGHY